MPALDELIGNTATHIADQNKHVPVKTLCGQALDKESTRYFAVPANFEQATCKVCRGIYFDQDWRGEQREEHEQTPVDQEPDSAEDTPTQSKQTSENTEVTETPPTRRLFATLEVPVNKHTPKGETNEDKES